MSLARFTLFYLLYCAFWAAAAVLIGIIFPDNGLLIDRFWLVFGFLAGITFIAYAVADIGMKRSPGTGVMIIMASIALKMIFSMAFVLIYSFKSREKGVAFVLDFFSLYLLFSFFEIYSLLRNLRHQNK